MRDFADLSKLSCDFVGKNLLGSTIISQFFLKLLETVLTPYQLIDWYQM